MLTIKVLGPGCPNCHKVEENARQAVKMLGTQARIEKVTDRAEFQKYNLLMTPGLVINEKVSSRESIVIEMRSMADVFALNVGQRWALTIPHAPIVGPSLSKLTGFAKRNVATWTFTAVRFVKASTICTVAPSLKVDILPRSKRCCSFGGYVRANQVPNWPVS